MEIIILIIAMVVVGLIVGWIAGLIWKDNRPMGVKGDYILAVIVWVVVGLMDWFIVPLMGFGQTMLYLALIFEPALLALGALWLVRLARRS